MLEKLNYSDSVTDQTDGRKISEEERVKRETDLANIGISAELIETIKIARPHLYASVDEKIEGLKQRGFDNPVKMISSLPQILGYAFENIDEKIEGLKQRGFDNPVKMISSLPPVLGYAFENIDEKIEGLKQRGFDNPVKMISSLPPVLGYAFENIDKKIRTFAKLLNKSKIEISPIRLIENILPLLGTKDEKTMVIARVISKYCTDKSEVSTKLIRKLIFCNIEDVLVTMIETENELLTMPEFIKKVDAVKKRKLLKTEKRGIINGRLPESNKIKRKYFKSYPLKN